MAQEAATNPDSTYRYAVHKQVDMRRGVMDRYCNIKPYNRNRVRLRVPDGTLDYVNASAVVLPSPRRGLGSPAPAPLRYIAMQGPVENSVDSVWRMVAEQFDSPVVIVQLTTMFENGTIKCYPYFPMSAEDEPWILNEDDGWEDGWGAELRFDSMETLEDGAIELRKLILRVAPPAPSAAPNADADDADIEVTQTASPAPEPTEQTASVSSAGAEQTPSKPSKKKSKKPKASKGAVVENEAADAQKPLENVNEEGVSGAAEIPADRIVAREERIEYRDQDGNLLDDEQATKAHLPKRDLT
ncbi:Tyrosine-protein phosphatase 1 like [Verticillium longisporum]|nr:Tyrosine-protein phosphatase 1 like [Verticillium longisporum]